MRVVVEIFGVLRRPHGARELEIELPAGATPRDLFAALGYTEAECRMVQASVAGHVMRPHDLLEDGARVTVFAPTGGG